MAIAGLLLMATISVASAGINIYPKNYLFISDAAGSHPALVFDLEEKYIGNNNYYPKVLGANSWYLPLCYPHNDPQTWTFVKASQFPNVNALKPNNVALLVPTRYCAIVAIRECPNKIGSGILGVVDYTKTKLGLTDTQYNRAVLIGLQRIDEYNSIYITTNSWIKR